MDYEELLQRYDQPPHWEFPPGFNHGEAARRFAQFVDALSALLGTELNTDTDSRIQDASFHSQIYLPIGEERFALIRFSNFGHMVTVSDDDPVSDQTLQLLQKLFAEHGYVYVLLRF